MRKYGKTFMDGSRQQNYCRPKHYTHITEMFFIQNIVIVFHGCLSGAKDLHYELIS